MYTSALSFPSRSSLQLTITQWDHVGTPEDFTSSQFVVGSGTIHLLENGAPPHYPVEIFDPDLLPRDRTKELPPTSSTSTTANASQTTHTWSSLATFPNAIDFFGDGSLYVIDTPGHLFGHVNLLARLGPNKWAYLGGDCCHDYRILTGEKDVALYDDGHGALRSVHVDTDAAKESIKRIKPLMPGGELLADGVNQVEVIVAHDGGWRDRNKARFFPGTL
jgi:glyoxylase-like metal-dependent hydrolase (beta-lactamase superfamily II)